MSIKYMPLTVMFALGLTGAAQTSSNGKFSIKASTEIGLANSFSTQSSLSSLASKVSGSNTGIDFGWIFYQKSGHNLEANIGVAYSPLTATFDLGATEYNYAAPVSADEDGETYIRYYELGAMSQKVKITQLSLPIYLSYSYECSQRLRLHADLGVRFGFKTSCSLDNVDGEVYSYGIYPQYDNLKIDASYMNGLGRSDLAGAVYSTPYAAGVATSVLAGVGAEIYLAGPLSVDLSLRYNAGVSDIFKSRYNGVYLSSVSAPVTYTVAEGQSVKPMSDYLKSSKFSQLMLKIGLICRF